MTKTEALTKLLALGPIYREQLALITSWPESVVDQTVRTLIAQRVVAWAHVGSAIRLLRLTDATAQQFPGWCIDAE